MKYLTRREYFLRSTKLIESKTDILKEVYPLNEGTGTGGPFYNEDAFYDTALGRIFSHVIRKIGIMANLVRIRPVIRRLEHEFNRLAIEGILENLETDEERIDIYRVQISALYQALVMLVDNEGNVGEIKFATDSALSLTNELLEKPVGKEMKLEVPKKELEDFKKFLEQFKDDEGGKESEEEEEEEESDNQNYKKEHIDNLFALKGILEGLKSLELGIAAAQNSNSDKKTKNIKPGDTLQKISQETGVDITTIKSKNTWLSKYNDTDALPTKDKTTNKEYTLVLETLIIESSVSSFLGTLSAKIVKLFKSKGGDQKNIKQNILNALIKYRDSIRSLSDNNKIPITLELINELITNKEKYAEKISVLYREVREYMVGKKKATLNYTPDKLMEAEDLTKKQVGDTLGAGSPEIIEVEGKKYYVSDMAWKISKFALRAYQVNDADLYDVLSAVSEPTKNFVNTLKQLNNKIEAKKESRLLDYIGFKLIREADGDDTTTDTQTGATTSGQNQAQSQTTQTEPNAVATGTVSERIKEFFDKNCKTVRTYIMDKAEIIKICENFDKITEQKKDTFIIPGMDPIIQIVRLFNRAYKLHTVPTISKRTGGKVSASVYKDYTSFGGRSSGGDSLNGWAGPFRNNKIFNLWEDAVVSIMGSRKFEFIFTPKTKLRIPKVPNPVKQEDYEFREGAGAKLRTFMNDMLDGDELYKDGTTQGAQKRFIEKYFGELKDGEVKDTTIPGSDDASVNSGTSTAVAASTQIANFTKNQIVNAPWKKGMIFAVLTTETDKDGKAVDATRYFMIEGPNSVSFSKTMFFFDKLITKSENADAMDGRKWKVEKGDIAKMEERAQGTDKFEMRYTKDKKALDQIFKKDNKLTITYNTGANKDVDNTKSFKIKEIFWLGLIGEDKKFKPFELNIKPESYKKIRTQYGSGSPLVAAENVATTLTSNNRLKIDVTR
jgi:LysM repeat protein